MYEVGQVLYVLIKKDHSVIPVKVVEKILRKTLEGESISYIVELPTPAQDQIDLQKLGTGIYSSSADAMSVMIENARTTIAGIVKKAEDIAKTAFNVDLTSSSKIEDDAHVKHEAHDTETTGYQHAHSFNLDERIEVDLGQGMKAKVSVSGLET